MFHNPFSKKKVKSSEEIVLKKDIECLILLGDHTLDNFHGLSDKHKDIEWQIISTLSRSLKGHHSNHPSNSNSADASEFKSSEPSQHKDDVLCIHNLSLSSLSLDGMLDGASPSSS